MRVFRKQGTGQHSCGRLVRCSCRTEKGSPETVSSKKFCRRSLAILLFAAAASLSFAQTPQKDTPFRGHPVRSRLTNPSIEQKVNALLKQMTLEEKVGQLVQYSVGTA